VVDIQINVISGNSGGWQYLDGVLTRISITDTSAVVAEAHVVGYSNDGLVSGGYKLQAEFRKTGPSISGGYQTEEIAEGDVTWDARLLVNPPGYLDVEVKGNGQTIRWVATVRATTVEW